MKWKPYLNVPKISEIATCVVIIGDDNSAGTGREKFFVITDTKEGYLGSGNKTLRENLEFSELPLQGPFSLLTEAISDIAVRLTLGCLQAFFENSGIKLADIGSITIDRSEVSCLILPSGGSRKQRSFYALLACAIPIVFLENVGISLNKDPNIPWRNARDFLNGKITLPGTADQRFVVGKVLECYLSG